MTAHRVGLPCVPPLREPLRRYTITFTLCETWPDPNPFPCLRLWRWWPRKVKA